MTVSKESWKPMATENAAAVLQALGLCRKAGKVVIGTDAVCEALRERQKPVAVFAANDLSANTEKRLRDKCATYGVPLRVIPAGGEALAHALGKSAKTAAVAVTDENLCRLVMGKLG